MTHKVYWQPFSLTFPDALIEARFHETCTKKWMAQDALVFALTAISGFLALLYVSIQSGEVFDDYIGVVSLWTVVSLAMLGIVKFSPSWYKPHRFFCVCIIRVWTAYKLSKLVPETDMGALDGNYIIQRLLMSPVVLLAVLPAVLRLPLFESAFTQFLAMVGSGFWIPRMCSMSLGMVPELNTFNAIGQFVDSVVVGLVNPFVSLRAGEFPCAVVCLFLHLCGGMLLPCFLGFCMEVCERSHFANAIIGGYEESKVLKYRKDALSFAAWAFLFLIQAFWVNCHMFVAERGGQYED